MKEITRRLLFFITVLALLLAAAAGIMYFAANYTGKSRPYSSHETGSRGSKAFYLLLEEMGQQISRWSASFELLPGGENGGYTLIMTEPSGRAVRPREAAALYHWVESGNRLLLLSIRQPTLLETFGLETTHQERATQKIVILSNEEYPLLAGISRLDLSRTAYFTSASSGEALIEEEGEIYLISKQIGDGELIAIADPEIITNRRIPLSDNLILLLNAVDAFGQGSTLIFSERHHLGGQLQPTRSEDRGESLLTYMPAVWLQLSFFTLLLLFALGCRFGAPRPLPGQQRRSPLDFIGPAASIWQKARARRLAIETLYQGLKRRIGKKYRLGHSPRTDELVALGERVTGRERWQLEKDFLLFEEAARNENLSAAEMLALARRIDRYRKEFL